MRSRGLGGEREPRNHGSVLTAADGSFRLEMEQIVPNFGQPHAHLAYHPADAACGAARWAAKTYFEEVVPTTRLGCTLDRF